MSKTTLAGHPLHPQMVMMPLALLPFSFAMDVMYSLTGKKSYADSAYITMAGGCISAIGAAAAALPDYSAIPTEHPAKKTANMHVILNVATLSAYGLNLVLRSRTKKPGFFGAVLSGLGAAGIVAAQWYGGSLVYDHGMRVKGVDPIKKTKEMKIAGDEKVAKVLEGVGIGE